MKDLQLMAGYTFAESHDAADRRVSTHQPRHLFKMATNYRLPGHWHRVTVGGNVYWQSSTFFKPSDEDWYSIDDPTAKFEQKSYALVQLRRHSGFTGARHVRQALLQWYRQLRHPVLGRAT